MRPSSALRAFLVAGAVAAVAVFALDVAGWWQWTRVSAVLSVNPQGGAVALAESHLVSLPSFVERSRKFPVRLIGMAARETVVGALTRLGSLQITWIPAHPSGFTHLSHAALLGDQPTAALDLLTGSLVRDPLSPSLRRLRALVLLYLGVVEEAIADLAIAGAVAPDLRTPEIELPPEDLRFVRREALRLRGEFYPRKRTETAIDLARMLRGQGDTGGAEEILADLEDRPEIQLELARWAIEEGRIHDAMPKLESVASRRAYPKQIRAGAWSLIATVRDRDGDREGALSAARTALEMQPDSPAPYVTLAGLAQRRGDSAAALGHLRRAWGMAPTDVQLLTRIAVVAEGAGKTADAVLALERAVQIEPEDPRHPAALAALLLRSGQHPEAAAALSRALDRFPADPELLRLAERLQRDIGIR